MGFTDPLLGPSGEWLLNIGGHMERIKAEDARTQVNVATAAPRVAAEDSFPTNGESSWALTAAAPLHDAHVDAWLDCDQCVDCGEFSLTLRKGRCPACHERFLEKHAGELAAERMLDRLEMASRNR